MSYRLSPQAELELEAIGDHIAEDSPANSQRFIEQLTGKFIVLGRNPRIGRARPELRADLRSFPYGAYLILYRAVDDGVEIVRVLRAACCAESRRSGLSFGGFDLVPSRAFAARCTRFPPLTVRVSTTRRGNDVAFQEETSWPS